MQLTKYQRHHGQVMWKKNIHSLLTLAAERSEPGGWRHGMQTGELIENWRAAGVIPALAFRRAERVKCTLLELRDKKHPSRRGVDAHVGFSTLTFGSCLENELRVYVFLCMFSACFTAQVQVHQNSGGSDR